ncbi:MAG: hypothetical protein H0W09_00755 [Solirubrobacterales bacterium]|nr:hypothetical protein [Solirubrobacterales bacterium]
MSARGDAEAWAEIVRELGGERDLRYEPIGGINAAGGPAALCPGGTNRLTGQLAPDFWGASCDAIESEQGGFLSKAVLPGAVLAKSHVPDLAAAVPPFNVESLEATPEDLLERRASRNRVEFESVAFNERFLATVAAGHDRVALRETFSPVFLDWAAGIEAEVDFGVSESQLYFMWRLRERTSEEYRAALDNAGQLFRRVQSEVSEHGDHTYPPGPWHAGLDAFPDGTIPGG